MNDKKHHDQSVNDVDRAIYDYLDEMLHDPAAEGLVSEASRGSRGIPDNVAHFDFANREAASSETGNSEITKRESTKQEPALPSVAKKSTDLPSRSRPGSNPQAPEPDKSKPYSLMDRPALLSESLLNFFEEPAEQAPDLSRSLTPSAPDTVLDAPVKEEVAPSAAVLPAEPPATPDREANAATPSPEPEPEPENRWCENGRPNWAQSRFECLIFNVGGLKLAVPLITLGSIHQIDRRFNALPGQYDWFIGILQTPKSGNIKVLDTGLCVMPERHDPASRETLAYVITIHGYDWGLACHGVEQSITLEPEQVKWRTQRGTRPWLAGTVLEHMCSLVDTDGFQAIIAQAERAL